MTPSNHRIISWIPWIASILYFANFHSLFADFTVTQSTDDGSGGTAGTLSWAILQANTAPAPINFSGVSTVTLSGSLPPIQNTYNINASGPAVTINAQSNQVFFVASGIVNIANFTISGAQAAGGSGGTGSSVLVLPSVDISNTMGGGGPGGGGGLGAGGGVFVNNSAVANLTDVYFTNCSATQGKGGAVGKSIQTSDEVSTTASAGGGGSMRFPGGAGFSFSTADFDQGAGGGGGGLGGGGGDAVGTLIGGTGGPALDGIGAGGAGTSLVPPTAPTPGQDFAGGGGAGGGTTDGMSFYYYNGAGGGYGGGGGGAFISLNPLPPHITSPGSGGFGAGSGGTFYFSNGLAYGTSGEDGQGLGGGVFVRDGGSLTLTYTTTPSSDAFLNCSSSTDNSVLFFQASSSSTPFAIQVNAGQSVGISGNITSDQRGPFAGPGLQITGGGTLTLSGNNNYTGGTLIDTATTLKVQSDASLGYLGSTTQAPGGIGLNGTLHILEGPPLYIGGPTFNSWREVVLSATSLITVDSGAIAQFNGSFLTNTLTVNGAGTLILNNPNNSNVNPVSVTNATLLVPQQDCLGTGSPQITLTGATLGLLEFSQVQNTITSNIVSVGSATLQAAEGVFANFSGVISGNDLNIQGPGTVKLSGTNTYTGQTTVNSGAILQIDIAASVTSSAITNNGTIQPGFPVFNFNVSGSGSLEIEAPQSSIGGTNTYTGGTVNRSTSLSFANSQSVPTDGPIQNFGQLTFAHGTGTVSPGVISGSGSIIKNSNGVLDLFYANTYTGNTHLAEGITRINNNSSLGTGQIILGEGATPTLQLTGSNLNITIDNPVSLANGGANIVVDATNTLKFTQPWTDVGGETLSISGLGTVALTPSHTFGGDIVIETSGTLNVGHDGSTSTWGSAQSTLTNNGIVSIGFPEANSSFEIFGNFTNTNTGFLIMTVDGLGQNDLLTVGNEASLDGTIVINGAPGAYPAGQNYSIIKAAKFTNKNVTVIWEGMEIQHAYVGDPELVVTVTAQSILAGTNPTDSNARAVLNYMRDLRHAPGTDLIFALNVIGPMNDAQATQALDQMHPALFGAFSLINVNTTSMASSILTRVPSKECCLSSQTDCGCKKWSLWLHPFGYLFNQDSLGEQIGFHANLAGVLAGLQYCTEYGLVMNIGGGYSHNGIHWRNSRGHGHMNTGHLGVGANYTHGVGYVGGALIWGSDGFHASRHIQYSSSAGSVDRDATHSSTGFTFGAHLEGGADVPVGPTYLEPFANLDYVYLYENDFQEQGADSLNLRVRAIPSSMIRSEIGLDLSGRFQLGKKGCWSPYIGLSGINEAFLGHHFITSSFQDHTLTFKVRTWTKPIWLAAPRAGVNVIWDCGLGITFRYAPEVNASSVNHKLDGRLQWYF